MGLMSSARPKIGITMGDPAGVGPELCLHLLADQDIAAACVPVVFGDRTVLEKVAGVCGLPLPEKIYSLTELRSAEINAAAIVDLKQLELNQFEPGQVNRLTGGASFQYIEAAIEAVQSNGIAAIANGPIHKEAWNAAGIEYPGHTELFAERTATERYCMMMTSPQFSCSLVTTHIGFDQVPKQLTTERIWQATRLTQDALSRILQRKPKLTMLGLNPHAGENGLFGNREEETLIAPAVEIAREQGIDITNPLPPDTAFLPWRREQTDGYICMYHDQGLIPFKAFNFDSGVNITLGLPIVRTSVDHGTALDIAWTGKADPSSLKAAVALAARLAGSR